MKFKNAFLKVIMRSGRRLFRNTPIQRLGLTTMVYKLVAKSAFPQDFLMIEFRGATIKYPGGDHTTLPTLVDGRYESSEFNRVIEFLDGLTEPIDVMDIGANVGIWTCVLARHPMVRRLAAFEPSQETLGLLRENIAINACTDKVTVVEAAVTNEVGVVNFTSAGSTATRRIEMDDDATESVAATTVDVFVETSGFKPGLIKVDVEGYEPLVLEGAEVTISTFRPALLLEYSVPQTTSAGLTWASCRSTLEGQYPTIEALTDTSRTVISNLAQIASDKRLLNLFASHDPRPPGRRDEAS